MNSGIQTALSSGRRVSVRNASLELDKLEVSSKMKSNILLYSKT
jgi:hypothetical protein